MYSRHEFGGIFLEEGALSICGGIAKKEILAGKHFVENYTEGKNIGTRVQRIAANLLRGHVAHGADDDARRGALRKGKRSGV